MIRLQPVSDTEFCCPICDVPLSEEDWYVPGMRMLAKMECPDCCRQFYGDLPVGHGLVYPSLINAETGEVYNRYGGDWFANWLKDSFATRRDRKVTIDKDHRQKLNNPLILNCLDGLYGHCLLKLLNAQYHIDKQPEQDLIVLIPSNLKWLVPEGVTAVWSFDIPPSRGKEWNDWIAREIESFLTEFDQVCASVAFSHPHPRDYDISRFSGVEPFSLDSWSKIKPTVTYIWRNDRLWAPTRSSPKIIRKVRGTLYALGKKTGWNLGRHEQRRNVITLGKELKSLLPDIEFTVAGLSQPGGLPDPITDLRTATPDKETEQELCKQYSQSHVVVGVHGSNMLLPSGHAGSVVELVPTTRWGNMTQDLLFEHNLESRQSIFNYRHVPITTPPKEVALIIESLISKKPRHSLHMARDWTRHEDLDHKQLRETWQHGK